MAKKSVGQNTRSLSTVKLVSNFLAYLWVRPVQPWPNQFFFLFVCFLFFAGPVVVFSSSHLINDVISKCALTYLRTTHDTQKKRLQDGHFGLDKRWGDKVTCWGIGRKCLSTKICVVRWPSPVFTVCVPEICSRARAGTAVRLRLCRGLVGVCASQVLPETRPGQLPLVSPRVSCTFPPHAQDYKPVTGYPTPT